MFVTDSLWHSELIRPCDFTAPDSLTGNFMLLATVEGDILDVRRDAAFNQ